MKKTFLVLAAFVYITATLNAQTKEKNIKKFL